MELFVDQIFDYLPVREILNLGCTNRFFSSVVADDIFWHRRIQEDFNFSGSDTARQTGWKTIYKRLSNSHVYVWGFVFVPSSRAPLTSLHAARRARGVLALLISPRQKSETVFPIRYVWTFLAFVWCPLWQVECT